MNRGWVINSPRHIVISASDFYFARQLELAKFTAHPSYIGATRRNTLKWYIYIETRPEVVWKAGGL